MKLRVSTLVLLTMAACCANAQFAFTWGRAYNGPTNGNDIGNAVAVDKLTYRRLNRPS